MDRFRLNLSSPRQSSFYTAAGLSLLMGTVSVPALAQSAGGQIEEVVVTAQKRSENIVNVPITVNVLSADQLQKTTTTSENSLFQLVPGLQINNNGFVQQPTIRGIGSEVTVPGTSSNVATYLDGIYLSNPLMSDLSLDDVSGIQVLKGPQGTLYGRNATGGAILISTLDPSFDTEARIRVSYGNYDDERASFYGTTAITDQIAVNVDASVMRNDGFMHNIAGTQANDRSADALFRAKILFQPTDKMKFILAVEHENVDDNPANAYSIYQGNALLAGFGPPFIVAKKWDQISEFLDTSETRVNGASLTGEIDLGWADIKSLTGWRQQDSLELQDADGSNIPFLDFYTPTNITTFSQELDIGHSGGGPLDWVAGLYYMEDRADASGLRVDIFGGVLPPGSTLLPTPGTTPYIKNSVQHTRAEAAFVDGTYNIWGNLFLTAGARYSVETKEYNYDIFPYIPCTPGTPPGLVPVVGCSADDLHTTWYSFTPRAVARYELAPDQSVYFSWSKGFKSGVYNADTASSPVSPVVDPEKITAYELGYKTQQSDWSFDASAYYYDYTDLQQTVYVIPASGIPAEELINAPAATSYGVEAQGNWSVTDKLKLNAGVAYNRATFGNFPGAPFAGLNNPIPGENVLAGCMSAITGQVQNCSGPIITPGGANTVGVGQKLTNAKGRTLPRAPEFTGNLGFDFMYPDQVAGGSLEFTGNYYFSSKVFFDLQNQESQDPYGLLNLQVSWLSPNDRYRVSIYGNNITDQRYLNSVFVTNIDMEAQYGTPLTYGIKLEINL